jgi:hypothetical protein
MAMQYQRFGYITNSMIVVNILQALYVADLFINEHWYIPTSPSRFSAKPDLNRRSRYLHTIDICHDHFGFYFAWGSGVFLPTTYTLQSQYLARHPIQRNPLVDLAILLAGLSGYAIFRVVNHQKHVFRRTKGNCKIWGSAPKYINCVYKTADGSVHKNMLLCSGKPSMPRTSKSNAENEKKTSLTRSRSMGSRPPRKLRRRPDPLILNVRRLRLQLADSLVLCDIHDTDSRPSVPSG